MRALTISSLIFFSALATSSVSYAQSIPSPVMPSANDLTVTRSDGSSITLHDFFQAFQTMSTLSGSVLLSVQDSISAAGTSYSDATQLKASSNVVTQGTSDQGVKLPAVQTGIIIEVLNRSDNSILIYPDASTAQIESNGAGVGQVLISGGTMSLIKTDNSQWRIR